MQIPKKDTIAFARNIATICMSSADDRRNRNDFFENFAFCGSADVSTPAMFNKVASSLDELESLLFSPVSLRFQIGDPDVPNILNEAKGRAAAARIRKQCRQSDGDNKISQVVGVSLRKGLGILKLTCAGKTFTNTLVQPEFFGVLHENYEKLDHEMEAFNHRMLITPNQFRRLVQDRPDAAELWAKAKNHMQQRRGLQDASASAMPIVTGGLYPFAPAGSANPSGTRGIVDWMAAPKPSVDPTVESAMLEMDETYVWDDDREDWATFQTIGEDVMVAGKTHLFNAYAYNTTTKRSDENLKGDHPFNVFCVNPWPDYFWGISEVTRLVLLQEAINARITGINRLLRKQEDPPTKFIGSTGVNQVAVSRFNKPGSYWAESNPTAKIERDQINVPADLFMAMHEYERMFDELMGLPPIAKGQGEQGVRSAAHAETLVRMFSPRFKDRALLVERQVESYGNSMFSLSRAHIADKMIAWVPEKAAGLENVASKDELALLQPPAPGTVPVYFAFADLPDNINLTIDSHSSSPAFAAEAKALAFDLLKVGAMGPADLVDHVDAPDPEELRAGIQRREIAAAQAKEADDNIRVLTHSKGKK